DVKSNNILFDHEFRPHVADFGLAKTLQRDAVEEGAGVGAGAGAMSRVAGSYGYIVPVYIGDIDSREPINDITLQGKMEKKQKIVQYREFFDRTLASPDLTNDEMLKKLVETYKEKLLEMKTAE
ncbi:hypothetical protein S83_047761, partial [Arachis hypogaea]